MQYDYNTTRYNTSSIPQVIQCNTFLRVIRPRLPGPLHIRGRISHQANPCPPLACYSTLRFANDLVSGVVVFVPQLLVTVVCCIFPIVAQLLVTVVRCILPMTWSLGQWYCRPVTCYSSTLHFANASGIVGDGQGVGMRCQKANLVLI